MIADKTKSKAYTEDKLIRKAFDDFIIRKGHPCVMARNMFRQQKVDMHVYDNFGTKETARKILHDLRIYLQNYDFTNDDFYTFIAVFKDEQIVNEEQYEQMLWKQLQLLHEADDRLWDTNVSADPSDNNFSFSLLGQSFYIIGLHPHSSRKARQAPYLAMVFNLHWQFERLRKMGVYTKLRNTIRKRDLKFSGSINPMLQDFGHGSEARQYSGRKVDESWKCPFHHT